MKRVLIIDALNAYLRAYIVDPSLSTHGQPIGGIKGFIKILQKLVRETKPDCVIVAWDGPDGSRKRKDMDKNYKAGRKPIRVNRNVNNLTDDEQLQNRIWQQGRLMEYLNNMPVIQTILEQVEADDVISYVVQMEHFRGWQKIIVSNDKDFMQLCDSETVLMRPVKNEILNTRRIVEQTGVHPVNMALARAMIGDASDNLPGVYGVGFGTVAKRFGFLASAESATVDCIIEHCEQAESKLKVFTSILESKERIAHNFRLMQLYVPQISYQGRAVVKEAIENFEFSYNQMEIIKMMRNDGFGELNWETLRTTLNRIVYDNKKITKAG